MTELLGILLVVAAFAGFLLVEARPASPLGSTKAWPPEHIEAGPR